MEYPVFLMGMMGSGKTTWGGLLARSLQAEFIDLDEVIEEGEGRTISEIFNEQGEPSFRDLESAYLKGLNLDGRKVIALGGGTPCFNDNITWLRKNGYTVFLDMSIDYLVRHLTEQVAKRPLITGKSNEELNLFLSEMLKKEGHIMSSPSLLLRKILKI